MKCFARALLISAVLAAGLGIRDSSAQSTTEVPTSADVAAGKALVEQQCKACHGLDGHGIAPAIPNVAGQSYRYLITALSEYRQGLRIHAAVKIMAENLTVAGERTVAAYYASLPPVAPAPGARAEVFSPYDHGKALAQACTQCHGENGNSVIPGTPSLSGQQPGYFTAAIQEYLTGARETPPMHSLIQHLKALDFDSLALYFASQTPVQVRTPPHGDPAAGQRLTTLCAGCHGPRGVSTDSATPSLAGQDPQYLVDSLKAYRAGRKHATMQRAVAAVIKSDSDAENIAAFYAIQPGTAAERGQTLVQDIADKCNRCHSPGVANPSLAIPNIRGQDKDYLMMALRSYRENRRESQAMHIMTLPYGDAIIEGIASYYASQPPK
ncbi:MAG: c-type cytochrome [Beijerinckiaceae bacterium]